MGNRCRKKGNDFRRFTEKLCGINRKKHDMSVEKYMQIWFIGRTLKPQAGKAGSIPLSVLSFRESLRKYDFFILWGLRDFWNKLILSNKR